MSQPVINNQRLPDTAFSTVASFLSPRTAGNTMEAFGNQLRDEQRIPLIEAIVRPPPEAPRVTVRKGLNR
jgi:hypothetical protein